MSRRGGSPSRGGGRISQNATAPDFAATSTSSSAATDNFEQIPPAKKQGASTTPTVGISHGTLRVIEISVGILAILGAVITAAVSFGELKTKVSNTWERLLAVEADAKEMRGHNASLGRRTDDVERNLKALEGRVEVLKREAPTNPGESKP